MKCSKLRFKIVVGDMRDTFEVSSRFNPGGKLVLNKTEWRGKEPRSCCITNVQVSHNQTNGEALVEVTYRQKDFVSFLGRTRYHGWTIMALDRSKDGALLDGAGDLLKDGEKPVYLPYEVFEDIEFNDIDFGEFIDETEVDDLKLVSHDSIMEEAMKFGRVSISVKGTFVAARRSRPSTKIVLSNEPTGEGTDGFGTRIININLSTPHLEHFLMESLTKLMCDYIEGRVSIKSVGNDSMTFVELSDSLVDCEANEVGEKSWFNVLHYFTPLYFMEELAKKLQALYLIEASIVEGPKSGIVLRHESKID